MQFPGSLRLDTETFLGVFSDLCDSLFHHGFVNIIVVNGHGGNVAVLTVAINRYFGTTGRRIFVVNWLDLGVDIVRDIEGPQLHAEEAETSLAMALGQRVLMAEASVGAFNRGAAVREAGFTWSSFGRYGAEHSGPSVTVPMDMLGDISSSGVVGDATKACRETGERIKRAVVRRIVQVAREMAESSGGGPIRAVGGDDTQV